MIIVTAACTVFLIYLQTERLNFMSDRNERNRRNASGSGNCFTVCEAPDTSAAEAAAAVADAADEATQTRRRRASEFAEPVCISTNQIYDSCRDRDCVSNARVYLTEDDQELIDNAINVKLKKAEIIWVYTNIEPLSFNNGYFSVDLKFFVRTTLDVFTGVRNPTRIYGLSTFDKRVILFGSEGNSKIFKSEFNRGSNCDISNSWQCTGMPTVVVETVEPVSLSAKLVEPDRCNCCCDCDDDTPATLSTTGSADFFPENICSCFDDDLVISDNVRHVVVSYGLFSIIRLERDTQLLIDAVDFCIPTQECPSATEGNPCNLFNDIRFPIDEFFPSQRSSADDNNHRCGCGCSGNSGTARESRCNCGN